MSRVNVFIVAALSGGSCLACLSLLSRLDFPVIRFLRSLDAPLLGLLGDVGNRLGHGMTLISLCAGLWGAGRLLRRRAYRQAGIDAFIAYVLAGVTAQLLKRLVGRPRPRFAHQEAFDYGPSLQSGLDAFPSGHAAASFAVAAALARAFPAWAWAWYGAAGLVGVSRVIRGSHFLTDVLGGAVLGFLIGYVWSRPLAEWRRHVAEAWQRALPCVVGVCAMVWSVFSHPGDGPAARSMFWGGLALCAGGMVVRWGMARSDRRPRLRPVHADSLIVLGLAVSLQTWWIVAATLMACLAWRVMTIDEHDAPPSVSRATWLAGVCALTAALHGLRGLVPLS